MRLFPVPPGREFKLLLSANTKSYMPHRLAQQRMTLSDLGWPFHIIRIARYRFGSLASCWYAGSASRSWNNLQRSWDGLKSLEMARLKHIRYEIVRALLRRGHTLIENGQTFISRSHFWTTFRTILSEFCNDVWHNRNPDRWG